MLPNKAQRPPRQCHITNYVNHHLFDNVLTALQRRSVLVDRFALNQRLFTLFFNTNVLLVRISHVWRRGGFQSRGDCSPWEVEEDILRLSVVYHYWLHQTAEPAWIKIHPKSPQTTVDSIGVTVLEDFDALPGDSGLSSGGFHLVYKEFGSRLVIWSSALEAFDLVFETFGPVFEVFDCGLGEFDSLLEEFGSVRDGCDLLPGGKAMEEVEHLLLGFYRVLLALLTYLSELKLESQVAPEEWYVVDQTPAGVYSSHLVSQRPEYNDLGHLGTLSEYMLLALLFPSSFRSTRAQYARPSGTSWILSSWEQCWDWSKEP